MISIELNKRLDYETYRNFSNFSVAGTDFASIIMKDHPLISTETCEQYIDDYYRKNKEILERSLTDLTKLLKQKELQFFDLLMHFFKIDFRNNKYNGYISIFDCNPRFVEEKEFQIFYKRDTEEKMSIIFHEILHFAFFEYCDTNFHEKIKDLNKNSGKLWEISEIFNVIILNTPQFFTLTGRVEKLFYPELSNKLTQAYSVWENTNHNIGRTIDLLINDN